VENDEGQEEMVHGAECFLHWIYKMSRCKAKHSELLLKCPIACTSTESLQLDRSWGLKLRQKVLKKDPESTRFSTVEDYAGLMDPALSMVSAMTTCKSPVQKVRLWAEAANVATQFVRYQLQKDGDPLSQGLDAPDLPFLVHFLTAMANGSNEFRSSRISGIAVNSRMCRSLVIQVCLSDLCSP